MTLHTWELPGLPGDARTGLQLLLTGVTFLTSASGLVVYGLLWKKLRRPAAGSPRGRLRRFHRQIGLVVALTLMAFAFSGGYHALKEHWDGPPPPPVVETFRADELPAAPAFGRAVDVGTVRVGGRACFRVARPGGTVDYLDAATGATVPDGERRRAVELAGKFSGRSEGEIVATEAVTAFGGEYGFLLKRLPVVRVEFAGPGRPRYYVEPSTGALAAAFSDADAGESMSFRYLHKWHFLDGLGRTARDVVMMLFAAGNAAVTAAGVILFARK